MKIPVLPWPRGLVSRASTVALSLGLLSFGWTGCSRDQEPASSETNAPAVAAQASTNAAGAVTNAAIPALTNAPPAGGAPGVPAAATAGQPSAVGPAVPAAPTAGPGAPAPGTAEGIQVAFQGANVDMIVQWLAQNTGKTVIKHPRVQCQLTIVSSKKVSQREALDLVYRALGLEGFNAVETASTILILPEGQDVKMNPEVLNEGEGAIPEGRQRLVKIFPVQHAEPADLRDKLKPVLSEKGTTEVDERARRLIITDFNDNLRLAVELMKELDVASAGDSVVEVIPLRHAQAEDVSSLMGVILNAQVGAGTGAARPSSSPMPGGPPGMPVMMSGSSGGTPSPSGSTPGGAAGAGSSQVRIWPDRTANRLIVSTPKSRLEEVRRLVEILDKDKPEDVAVRVIPLRHVQAVDLVREIAPLYQKMSGTSLKERIEVAANERSNSLIVLSGESNFRAIQGLVESLDTDEAQERVIRTFPLRNADAQDVARQLQQLSDADDSSSRYPYYIFFSGSERGAKKKIGVVADRRRNAVVVQAAPTQMEAIVRMVKELDEPVSDDSLAPRIFQLRFISAVDLEDVLNELFLKRQQNRPYWYFDEEMSQGTPDRDVGRLYGKVRITSEPYSNTLIVTSNSKENLSVVEDIIRQLDVPSQAGETTLRIPLRFAKAASLANHLNILFARNGSPPLRQTVSQQQPNQPQAQNQQGNAAGVKASYELEQESREEGYFPWLGGTPDVSRSTDGRTTTRQVSDLVGRVRVVPDYRSNGLLVSANVHLLPQLLKLIEDLDAPTAQVLIEARILEVATDAMDRFGVRWSPDGDRVYTSEDYDGSIIANTQGRYTQGYGGRTTANQPGFGDVASTMTQLRSGILQATVNLDVLVQFLRKNTDATVLAAPQLNIADNEMGRLFVGQEVPFITDSQSTDTGGLVQSFDYRPVGIILEVTPHINKDGDVALRIRAESSGIQSGQTLFGGAIIDTRNFRTEVTARTGETLVLGGIIQKQMGDTVRKVPVLGDIPGLGWAFKKKDKAVRNVELMVFLRPRITRTPEEARALLEEVDRRTPLLQPWRDPAESPGAEPAGETWTPKD